MTTPSSLRIVFAGSPDFAVESLQALLTAGYHVVAVYTQPDRPAGRGRKPRPSPVKQLALELGIAVQQPESLKTAAAQETLRALAPDLMVVVAYGLLLPAEVLSIPRLGCINVHASLLPRWRGAAPIQRALLAADAESGVTIMQMERGLDTGPMLLKIKTPIRADDTGQSLHDRLAGLGARALLEVVPGLMSGTLVAQIQDNRLATYAAKLCKAEARLDWTLAASLLARAVRAYNPWPVAYCLWSGEPLRIWSATALNQGSNESPGTVLRQDKQGIHVTTGEGIFVIDKLQPPGKREMTAAEFVNAHHVTGQRFD